jgi:tRNA modification GTPase
MMEDTITAIATPPGTGGVAIIKISGSGALSILERVFSHRGKYGHAKMEYGRVMDGDTVLDSGYAVAFYAPRSYTGEDTAELHIHGSAAGAARVLACVVKNGARPAQPGEFTRRAFLNGRMDLTQAEAVCDFIAASSEAAAKSSILQMEGGLKNALLECQDRLTDIIAETEAAVEYPEEDLEYEITGGALPRIAELKNTLDGLALTYVNGRIIKEGFRVAIAGEPNVGKSSLMNALGNEKRSIVSDIPGTTRDTVEKSINVEGIEIKLVDTAGIRSTNDIIENEGVKRANEAIYGADLTLLVLDVSRETSLESSGAYRAIKNITDDVLIVWNKIDLLESKPEKRGKDEIAVSAATGKT